MHVLHTKMVETNEKSSTTKHFSGRKENDLLVSNYAD